MDLKVDEVIDGLFRKDAYEQPCDTVNVEDLEIKLPEWFDEKKYNQGRRFQKDFFFMQSITMILGLVAVMAIPTILSVLVGTRRSNSQYTAFKRYWSTYSHVKSWFDHDLKPGSLSWRSLQTVRSHHIVADRASKLKGHGTVSQRDMALTLFGFIGFTVLKPNKLGIRALQPGDWEAYNHFWGVIGYALGLEDRYNICRKTFNETKEICQILQDKVFTPCLTSPPDYFEHAAHVMASGLSAIHPAIDHEALVYFTKYLSNVPGYVYTEEDRLSLERKLQKQLKGFNNDAGVNATDLIEKCPIDFLPKSSPITLYAKDYETLDDSPQYKRLSLSSKLKIASLDVILSLYITNIGRVFFNLQFYWCVFIGTYLPYVAMWRFGIPQAYVSIFKLGPTDDVVPLPNSKYYNREPKPWFKEIWDCLIW
ncbi:uncharacterized protein LOC110991450 [Pieris rapae]|uniref:uncharacterized protein LOC110991450 n=1 Tax=Pieris rapae TaxID=64459 RepID=UPI001E27D9E7|nr:uncharacterized protein LOC110991450 [Pieris rapae]